MVQSRKLMKLILSSLFYSDMEYDEVGIADVHMWEHVFNNIWKS